MKKVGLLIEDVDDLEGRQQESKELMAHTSAEKCSTTRRLVYRVVDNGHSVRRSTKLKADCTYE